MLNGLNIINKEVAPGRRLKLVAGKEYLYDLDPEFVAEITDYYTTLNLLNELAIVQDKAKLLEQTAKIIMQAVIEKADGPYMDRTAELVELVAQQTGIKFPHIFERYAELFLLALRPKDKWTVTMATREKLIIEVYTCSLTDQFSTGSDCRQFCLGGFQAASTQLTGEISCECPKNLPEHGYCEFVFQPKA